MLALMILSLHDQRLLFADFVEKGRGRIVDRPVLR